MTSEEINREIARIELITDAKERSREACMLRQRIASENAPVVKMGKGIKVTKHMLEQSQQEIQTKGEFEENYIKDAISGVPGAYAGSALAGAMNMHPVGRIATPIVGAVASSPLVRPHVDKAHKEIESWDDANNPQAQSTAMGQAKNLARDFLTGNWDDW